MSPHPVSNEVLAVELGHVRETVGQILETTKRLARHEDVARIEDKISALEKREANREERLRVLEDEKTGRKAIIALLGAAVTILGGGGIALVLRALMSP